jgi:hypothetical protein
MTSSLEGGEGVSQKMTNDDMMTGGTTKGDNPRNQSLDLPLNYTWSLKEYVVGLDIYEEDSEVGKMPSSQTPSIKVQGDFCNPFRFTIFSTLPFLFLLHR